MIIISIRVLIVVFFRIIFEQNQADLEHATEELSGYLERDSNDLANVTEMKQKVQDKYRYCSGRRKVLLDHVAEGYERDYWFVRDLLCSGSSWHPRFSSRLGNTMKICEDVLILRSFTHAMFFDKWTVFMGKICDCKYLYIDWLPPRKIISRVHSIRVSRRNVVYLCYSLLTLFYWTLYLYSGTQKEKPGTRVITVQQFLVSLLFTTNDLLCESLSSDNYFQIEFISFHFLNGSVVRRFFLF